MSRPLPMRRAQLERDIAKAVDRLVGEFAEETRASPHAVDIELMPGTGRDGEPRYVVSSARAHFEERDLD